MSLTADRLRKPLPRKREQVPMPEFANEGEDPDECFVWVYGMTAREKIEHESWAMNREFTKPVPARALVMNERQAIFCVRDEDGNQLFSNDDVPVLQAWPSDVLARITKVADRLCEGVDPKKAAKN